MRPLSLSLAFPSDPTTLLQTRLYIYSSLCVATPVCFREDYIHYIGFFSLPKSSTSYVWLYILHTHTHTHTLSTNNSPICFLELEL
jgi:hypothetical protein